MSLITENQKTKLLYLIEKDFTLVPRGRYYTTREHDSLVIDVNKGLFYWNSRNIAGDALTYLVKVLGYPYERAKNFLGNLNLPDGNDTNNDIKAEKPNPITPLIYHKYGMNHRDYWYYTRGYTDETIDRFFLGFTGKYWVIPIYVNGEFRNFQCRWEEGGQKRVKNYYSGIGRLPFNFGGLPDLYDNTIYITEGMVDAIMLEQNGLHAVSSNTGTHGWDQNWSAELYHYEKIRIVFDNDKAGIGGARRITKYLKHNSEVLIWPDEFPEKYDITDLYRDGLRIERLESCFLPGYVL